MVTDHAKYIITDSELQHMKHKYEGYQGFVKGDCNPFDAGGARAISWEEGWFDARQDFEEYHPKCNG